MRVKGVRVQKKNLNSNIFEFYDGFSRASGFTTGGHIKICDIRSFLFYEPMDLHFTGERTNL